MQDKDRLIIIFYIDFSPYVDYKYRENIISGISKATNQFFDDSVKKIIVPTFRGDGDNRIEYINKDKLSSEELVKLEENINKYVEFTEKEKKENGEDKVF